MSNPEFTLSMKERARWRERTGPLFQRLSLDALSRTLGDDAGSELPARVRDVQAGREAGLRFFLASEPRRAALAEALQVPAAALKDLLAQSREVRGADHHAGRANAIPLKEPPKAEAQVPDPGEGDAAQTLDRLIKESEERLGEDRAVLPALLLVMQREARDLCMDSKDPTAALGPATALVEAELLRVSAQPDRALLRPLQRLLNHYRDLGEKAGLFRRQQDGVHFARPELPVLLMGRLVAQQPDDVLRDRCSAQRAWASAGWAATLFGDAPDRWVQLLLTEDDPLRRVDRALSCCAALAGGRASAASPDVVRAVRLCIEVLCWLCPFQRSPISPGPEQSPWELSLGDWQRGVLALARASLHLDLAEALPGHGPSSLRAVQEALALPTQLPAEDERFVRLLCLPGPGAARGGLDESFFRRFFEATGRIAPLLAEPFRETWMRDAGLPALGRLRPEESRTLLAEPDGMRPAGYLMNRPGLVRAWYGAWLALSDGPDPGALARLWVEAVLRLLYHQDPDDDAPRVLLVEAPEKLRHLGVWEPAMAGLRAKLKQENALNLRDEWDDLETQYAGADVLDADTATDIEHQRRLHQQCAQVLRFASLSPEEWGEIIARQGQGPSLPWRLFIDAGAPQGPIADWCVAKLRRARALPPGTPRGNVGMIGFVKRRGRMVPDPGMFLGRENGWQKAFDQAERALAWLLQKGTADAFLVLARACYLEQPPFEFRLGDLPGSLALVLSQSLWGYAVASPGGRDAILAWVAQGQSLPESLIIPQHSPVLQSILMLWSRLLQQPELATSAFAAFKRWQETKSGPWRSSAELNLKLQASQLAASAGADVAAALADLLEAFTSEAADPELPALLSSALEELAQHHPASAQTLLEHVREPSLLARLCVDGTAGLWRLLFKRSGTDELLASLEPLGLADWGEGLFTALLSDDPQVVRALHLQSQLRRPALFAAAAGMFTPDEPFWATAWTSPQQLPPLDQLGRLPDGPWLLSLIARSAVWPPAERRRVLARLAGFAADPAVRRACLSALLVSSPEPS